MTKNAKTTDAESLFDPQTFASCLNARGRYESAKFVLRLNPVVHASVNSLIERAEQGDIDWTFDELLDYSTYVHETIHWWQHKGSTSGLIRSLALPVQTHSQMLDLRAIASDLGIRKPLRHVAIEGELGMHSAETAASLNSVVNSYMDVEFFLALTANPQLAEKIYYEPRFEAAGHCFIIVYEAIIGALRDMFDPDGAVFEDPRPWAQALGVMAKERVEGYYYGTPIQRAPVGILHLYEGQARFAQLQLLDSATAGLSFARARELRMLDGIYGEAFAKFLSITKWEEPEHVSDPLVALFLLVCDCAINPPEGLLCPIEHLDSFYLEADPGIRFGIYCAALAREGGGLNSCITECSREQYLTAREALAEISGLDDAHPHLDDVFGWAWRQPKIDALMKEASTFEFAPNNIVPRVMLSQFVNFCADKAAAPEFFCWPGWWMSGDRSKPDSRRLWMRHLSLFGDKVDDGGVFPRIQPDMDMDVVSEAFNQFYAAVLLYGMTREWALAEGAFPTAFPWLTSAEKNTELAERMAEIFEAHYGGRPDEAVVVSAPDILGTP